MQEEQSQPDYSVPPPEIGDPQWADKVAGTEEEKHWTELEGVKRDNDRRWLVVYGWVVLVITITFTAIFLLSLIIWALHYMLPECWTWLSSHQLGKMQSVLFSGGMGAVISSVIKRQLDKLRT